MKKKLTSIFLLAAVVMLGSGCTKEPGIEREGFILSFGSQISVTKGELKKSISSFFVKGYKDSQLWFPGNVDAPQEVITGTQASFPEYKWKNSESRTFYAYANLPSDADAASASIASDGVTLTYSEVPASVDDQVDILLGKYIGKGNDGKVTISFDHALTSVRFVKGELVNTTINDISLSGVYTSGSVKLGASGLGAWQDCEVSENKMTCNLGDTLILIPQNLDKSPVVLTVSATVASKAVKLTAKLDSGNWEAGKINTHSISYEAENGLLFSEPVVTSWTVVSTVDSQMEEVPPYVEMKMGAEGKETLKWYKYNLGAEKETDYGRYYHWAGTTGYIFNGSNWEASDGTILEGGFTQSNTPYAYKNYYLEYSKYNDTSDFNRLLELSDDAAHVELGSTWRMPTTDEFYALFEACGGTGKDMKLPELPSAKPGKGIYKVSKDQNYISDYKGTEGILFCDGTNMLFFPATGYGEGDAIKYASNCYYWTNTRYDLNDDWVCDFEAKSILPPLSLSQRTVGLPVRPVSN